MAFWNRRRSKNRDNKKKLVKTISIQGMSVEGYPRDVILESMLTGRVINISVPGTTNAFTNYEDQVDETYKKYNGNADFGNQQTRAIVDLRTAFIAGEGISISCRNNRTSKWIEDLIKNNSLDGRYFINAVKAGELCGQNVFVYKKIIDKKDYKVKVKIRRLPYESKSRYKPIYSDIFKDEVIDIHIKTDFGWTSLGESNFLYTRIGGDDFNSYGPVTRIGVVLTDIENYDRALKDIRRLNHVLARITPTFETDSDAATTALKKNLQDLKWTIGKAFIGKAKFKYEVPSSGAHDNLMKELAATIKTISSTTGVPVHWVGHVDLMSNRSTADTLYEMIKNATSVDRVLWEKALYDLIYKAQEFYIDSGGSDLRLDPDFQVRLPLISFENFLEKVRALNIAYADEAISIDDYMNILPGIDPLKTKKAIEDKKKKDQKDLLKMGITNTRFNLNNPNDEGDDDEQINNSK